MKISILPEMLLEDLRVMKSLSKKILIELSIKKGHTGIPGLWTLNSGRWTLDSGRWTLDAGLWTLDSGRWMLDARLWTLDSGHWMLHLGS